VRDMKCMSGYCVRLVSRSIGGVGRDVIWEGHSVFLFVHDPAAAKARP
jgi:hypothetical protein